MMKAGQATWLLMQSNYRRSDPCSDPSVEVHGRPALERLVASRFFTEPRFARLNWPTDLTLYRRQTTPTHHGREWSNDSSQGPREHAGKKGDSYTQARGRQGARSGLPRPKARDDGY
jgi:hypothetical protein